MVYNLTPIPPDRIATIWPHVRPLVEKAITQSDDYDSPDEVFKDLTRRDMTLCTISKDEIVAIVCVEFDRKPEGIVASVTLLGGSGLAWLEDIDQLEEWCASIGATRLELTGRTTWKRLLPEYGERAVVLSRVLNG